MATFLVYFLILTNACLVMAMSESHMGRKFGKHSLESPSEAPKAEEERPVFLGEVSGLDEAGEAGAPEEVMEIVHPHHRRSYDKSICGGGVIIGGLVIVFLVSIFCYIRATRRSKNAIQPGSPVSSSTGRKKAEPASPSNDSNL